MAYFRKRGKTWYFTISMPQQDGKYKKVERAGGKTKSEAEAKYRQMKDKLENGIDISVNKKTSVHDYFVFWLNNYVSNLKHNTQSLYAWVFNTYIDKELGSYDIKKITPAQLQAFIDKQAKSDLSKNTVATILNIIKIAFKSAVLPYGFLNTNPCAYVRLPKVIEDVQTKKVETITVDQYNQILEFSKDRPPFRLAVIIAFNTGMRCGEVCALRWRDIDLKERVIHVNNNLVFLGGNKSELSTPKTKAGYRDIHFGDTLYKELLNQKMKQNKIKKMLPSYNDQDFVVAYDDGKFVSTPAIKNKCVRVAKKLGFKFHFHMLRHTHASLLLENGASPKEVQLRLGHSTLEITMNTYVHMSDDTKKHTGDIFEKINLKNKSV